VTVITGRIERIDAALRLVVLGVTTVRVPGTIPLTGLEPGMSVTITYEDRAGELWAMEITRVRL
jgi:hypothetical protein